MVKRLANSTPSRFASSDDNYLSSETLTFLSFQISFAYSSIVLSDENFPAHAVLSIAIFAQPFSSWYLLEIKGHLEYHLPEESGNDKRALAYLWRDVLWAIWGTASENGGSKVIKTAPKELKEKYQQVFA